MARYLVLEFEDNESALKLKQKIDDARAGGAMYRVVGLFIKPRRLCTCPRPQGTRYKLPMHERGLKFGWWVCPDCNRPRMGSHQLVNQLKGDDLYEGFDEGDYEFCTDGLSIGPIHKKHLMDRLPILSKKGRKALKKEKMKHGR